MNLIDLWFPYVLTERGVRFVQFHTLPPYHRLAKYSDKIVVVNLFKNSKNMRKVVLMGHGTIELEPGRSDILSESKIRTRPENWDIYLTSKREWENQSKFVIY